VTYETTNGMYADCVDITDIYCTSGEKDSIVKLYSNIEEDKKGFHIFDFNCSENLQEHALYIKSDIILKTFDKTDIVLYLEHSQSRIFDKNLREAFLSENALYKAGNRKELCISCFNGQYPTALYQSISEANKDGKF
jgi:hypothetical protein